MVLLDLLELDGSMDGFNWNLVLPSFTEFYAGSRFKKGQVNGALPY